MMEHRARQKYTAAAPFFRWMFNACEKARAHADQWPAHIYVPLEAAMEELLSRKCAKLRTVLFLSRRVLLTTFVSDRRDFPGYGRDRL